MYLWQSIQIFEFYSHPVNIQACGKEVVSLWYVVIAAALSALVAQEQNRLLRASETVQIHANVQLTETVRERVQTVMPATEKARQP